MSFGSKIETSVDKEKPRQSLIYDRSHFKIDLRKRFRTILLLRVLRSKILPGVNVTKTFGAKAERFLRRYFLRFLMVTVFGKNVPKYGVQG